MVGGPPSAQDRRQIKDDAELIKHLKYGVRILLLDKVASANMEVTPSFDILNDLKIQLEYS